MYYDFFGNNSFWGAQDYYAGLQRAFFWIVGLVIAAIALGIILNASFLKRSNEGKFKGFWGKVYDIFSMNRFYTEDIVKFLGVITFLIITFIGLYMIFTGSIAGGVLLIIFGNIAARLGYELIIMFAILTRKTVSMDRRLKGIEKFYSDDMEDWENGDNSAQNGVTPEEEYETASAEREGMTFEEKLKEAFGDLEETEKYGYDEECKECDNWDEVSQDCYCEDDCLTCDKPDQDKKESGNAPLLDEGEAEPEPSEEEAETAETEKEE